MLDMGFIDDVSNILEHTPPERQTCLFSATLPPNDQIADTPLHEGPGNDFDDLGDGHQS